jgi:DNA-binding CsgD family transcriptional regulator
MNPLTIYPGLFDKRVEFFAYQEDVYCFYDGMKLHYNEFTDAVMLKVINHMAMNPHLVKWVQDKTKLDFGGDFTKRYIYYWREKLNLTPDIDLDGTMNGCDFFACDEDVPMMLSINNGKPLSKREIEVLKEVTLPDKLIADHLHNSTETILSHFQNIRQKTGLHNKLELTQMACKQGII